ncbi:MAG: molecular chaperone HtpG [Nitrococcus sp.]|nr:molecular chaperone HtpG [Nitrococcus sp.]
MTVQAEKETLEFQAEVQQLLKLMIQSVYSNREAFLRELISNASDATDRLRFDALRDQSLLEDDPELKIRVDFDLTERTITVSDNGIGMNRDDVVKNLGTIAHSGTRAFIDSLTGDQAQDARLIGQFGVGFYSSFIVSDRVSVHTRKAGEDPANGVRWDSTGEGAYTVEHEHRSQRGTEVVLHLRMDAEEYLDGKRLREIIRRYSDHISIPIRMPVEAKDQAKEGEASEQGEQPIEETVNRASALWMRPKYEIPDPEYIEFYKHVAHDYEEPQTWVHYKVEGTHAYTALLYIPSLRPMDLYAREQTRGVRLYVRRVFVMEDTQHLMPRYLRFVRGIVDTDDLPLNVSRELLQQNRLIDTIRAASVKRILEQLEKLSRNEPKGYQEFWARFGTVLKEGVVEDTGNRERIAGLLRFCSTHSASEQVAVSLDDYIKRMQPEQKAIYYVTAETLSGARKSPHLEVFSKKGLEVLLLHEPVDEWLVTYLLEYKDKPLHSVAKGELDLGALEDAESKAALQQAQEAHKKLVERLRETLGERVSDVRVSHRLTDSPACLVVGEHELGAGVMRMLRSAGQPLPQGNPVLEINPEHEIVHRLNEGEDDGRFEDWAQLLFEQAVLNEGGQLEDPSAFVQRLNALLSARYACD